MNRKFKAPPTEDLEQWAKVQFLSDHGFRFGSVFDEAGLRVPYPRTLREARAFVLQHADRIGVGWLKEEFAAKRKPVLRRKTQKKNR